jgi:heme-degrading monooxygenase HmoA
MYASVRNYVGGEGLVDELIDREGEVRSLIEGIPGFRAYYLIRTDKGDAVSVSVYDDRSGAEESNRAAAEWIRGNLPDISLSAPQVSAGEVVIQA